MIINPRLDAVVTAMDAVRLRHELRSGEALLLHTMAVAGLLVEGMRAGGPEALLPDAMYAMLHHVACLADDTPESRRQARAAWQALAAHCRVDLSAHWGLG